MLCYVQDIISREHEHLVIIFRRSFAFLLVLGITLNSMIGNNLSSVYTGAATSYTYVKGNYAVISNESTSETVTASTGSFSLTDYNPTVDYNDIDTDSYKIDYVIPLNENIVSSNRMASIQTLFTPFLVSYNVGDTRDFYVYNFVTKVYDQITATLKSSGTKSDVWVNTPDYDMTNADADKITAEFDNNISPKITSVFGQPSDTDEDGKINILCYDIKDGFSGSGGYYAGYFDPNDLYENTSGNPYPYDTNPNSNQSEVFYIDVYPGMGIGTPKDVTQCYGTIAHEFQHMVNWNQNFFIEGDTDSTDNSTWLNEALSEAASQVYSGQVSQSRIDYYNSSSTITSGSPLLRWDSTLDNYSLAYLFSQYVKEQAGIGDAVFTEIMLSTYNDYRAVEEVIQNHIDPTLTFGRFMTYFRTALLLKRSTGLYGFKGNPDYDSIAQKIYTGGNNISLYGGGAIVVAANPTTGEITIPADKGATVNYFIVQNPPTISISPYNSAPTNQDIVVTASIDIGTINETSHTFTENGSFDFVATNRMGDISTQTVTVTNIDKIAPVVSGISDGASYSAAEINFDEGTAFLNGNPCENGVILRSAGSYNLSVVDEVWNETSLDFTINEILYKYAPGYITGLSLNTTMADFVSNANILVDETARAFDSENAEITDTSSTIGTGATMRIFRDDVLIDTYSVLIYGDASGDGDISLIDLAAIKQHLLNSVALTGAYEKAGDIGRNGSISISDLLSVKMHLIGIQFISQA